jgi:hypothetical protein
MVSTIQIFAMVGFFLLLMFSGCSNAPSTGFIDNTSTFSVNCLNCNGSTPAPSNTSITIPNPINATIKNTQLKVYGNTNATILNPQRAVNITNYPKLLNTTEYDSARIWEATYTGNNQRLIVIDTNLSDAKGFVIYVNNTFVGTLSFLNSHNKKQNYSLGCYPMASGAAATSLTTGSSWWCPASIRYLILGTTAWTSGSMKVTVYSSSEQAPQLSSAMTCSGSVTATVSTTTNIPATGQGSSTTHTQLINSTKYLNSVKTSVGVIGSLCISNSNQTSGYYLKMYNKASAPAPASDTPIFVYYIPANYFNCIDTGAWGNRYTTGIAYTVVKNVAKTDSTAPNKDLVSVNIAYT